MRKNLNTKANDITIGGTILFTMILSLLMAIYWIINNIDSVTEVFVAVKDRFSVMADSLKQCLSAKKGS